MSKKVGREVGPRELDDFMIQIGDEGLKKIGVWRTSFGKKYMPIVVVNPSHKRALEAAGDGPVQCICTNGKGQSTKERDTNRYYNSMDYDAGKHAVDRSSHVATCGLWVPPSAGHLHSWRRGFDNS